MLIWFEMAAQTPAASCLREARAGRGVSISRRPTRYLFLDPSAPDLYPDWERIANETVAIMRHTAGADPRDPRLAELVGEHSMRSEAFRTRWASQYVRFHNRGTKRFRHPLAGELTLNFERFDLAADTG